MAVLDLGKVVPEKGVDYFTQSDINDIISDVKSGLKISDLENDAGYVTKNANDLTYYTLATGTGSSIELSINSSTYVMTLNLKNSAGTVISTDTVDLPLESVVVNGSYDSTNKKIVLTLQSGSTIEIPVGDLVSGLQAEITSQNKLSADLVDDTNTTNKFTNATEKATWSGKQDALVSGTSIKTVNGTSVLGSGDVSNTYVIPKTYNTTAVTNMIDDLYQRYKNGEALNIYGVVPVSNFDVTLPLNFSNFSTTTSLVSCYYLSDVNAGNKSLGYYAYYQLSKTNDHITSVLRIMKEVNVSAGSGFLIKTDNIASYTPTVDSYNPASAKYAEKMVESLAPVYDSTATYAQGDYVSYQGKLYKCNTTISTAEAWNSSHWTETTATAEMGGGSNVTPKYYVDGSYFIYNVTPGNYNIPSASQVAWTTISNISATELSEALTLAYQNDKYLVLNIPTTATAQTITFIASSKVAYGIGMGLILSGTMVTSSGNVAAVNVNITYESTQTTATVSQAKAKMMTLYALGTTNTVSFTPTAATHPATKGYVDDAITSAITTTLGGSY